MLLEFDRSSRQNSSQYWTLHVWNGLLRPHAPGLSKSRLELASLPGPYAPSGYRSEVSPGGAGFPGLDALQTNFYEWYSWAVVASVASAAGLVCHIPVIDTNRVDVRIETVGLWLGRQRQITLQLKSSSNFTTFVDKGQEFVSMSFTRAYYDDLQAPRTVPVFLVLVALPSLHLPWTRVRQGIHALSAAAWWGRPTEPSNNAPNQTVRIPAGQRLDVAGLRTMLAAG